MKLIIAIIFLVFSVNVFSQQPDIYRVNNIPLEINPAFAGSYNQFRIDFLRRQQWIGEENSPVANVLSTDIALPGVNSGVGFHVYTLQNQAIQKTVLNFSYAYIIKIGSFDLQFGAAIKYNHNKFDFSSLITYEPDPLLQNQSDKFYRLSLSGGALVYNPNFYFSVSYFDFLLQTDETEMDYNNHFWNVISGYHFFKGEKLSFCPSIIMKSDLRSFDYQKNGHTIVGVNLTATLNGIAWFGFAYDSNEEYSVGAGVNIWRFYGAMRYVIESKNEDYLKNGIFEINTGFYFDRK